MGILQKLFSWDPSKRKPENIYNFLVPVAGVSDSEDGLRPLSVNADGALITTATISGNVTLAAETVVTSGTPSAASVTDASSTALALNAARVMVVICNSGANDVFLNYGATAIAGSGIYLVANGGVHTMDSSAIYRGVISAICATGKTSTLSILEGV